MSSVAKDVQLTLGMIACNVRVESAAYTEDFLTNVCVGHANGTEHEPLAVQRPLTCATCGPITMKGLKKAKKEGGGLVVLEEHEVAGLKEDATPFKGKIQLIPYNAAEVLAHTGQGDKYYQLHPQTNPENYSLLMSVITNYPGKAFIARYAVRTKTSLFMAQVKDGCILIQERTFTDNLKPVPSFNAPVNEAFVPLAVQMVESMETVFNSDTFTDTYNRNLVEITREREIVGGKYEKTAPVAPEITADLVRSALMEYRNRKTAEIAQEV
jgi:non-homologous end joining protein Ku